MSEQIGLQDIDTLARQESAQLHHYFVGVEHLFIALTQLHGGLTNAVLEQHGLSPRFVRYSIRETVGRYEDRRFWPGFPETPRAQQVLARARANAGEDEPAERDLLLAILDENDSIPIRVLLEMGADPARLRDTAALWSAPLQARAPEVPVMGDVTLDAEQLRVLKLMFRDYGEVQVVHELAGGYSGARVLLVRPVRVDRRQDAPVVVKLDDRHDILYERRRYDLYVKGTLPAETARLVDAPVVPDDSRYGGLKYTFVGRVDETEPVSLRELARERPAAADRLLRTLFETFGPTWWQQRQPYRFGAWREYEHVLPPALALEAIPPHTVTALATTLAPLGAWSRTDLVLPGELVTLNGFTVQKIHPERGMLQLAAGAQPEAVNRASKVEVRGLALTDDAYFRGEVVSSLAGRVISTRGDLLLRQLHALEPDFDTRLPTLDSPAHTIPDLPNPLKLIGPLLERQVSGYLSTVHGDLHLGNILVGPTGNAWLIDFARTREGHTLFDWALLELSWLVEVVARVAAPGWAGAWEIAALLDQINHGADGADLRRHPAGPALGVLKTIRAIAGECLASPGRWTEYYVALALLGLRLMDWHSEPVDARRLAFLASALATAAARVAEDPHPTSPSHWVDTTDIDQTAFRSE